MSLQRAAISRMTTKLSFTLLLSWRTAKRRVKLDQASTFPPLSMVPTSTPVSPHPSSHPSCPLPHSPVLDPLPPLHLSSMHSIRVNGITNPSLSDSPNMCVSYSPTFRAVPTRPPLSPPSSSGEIMTGKRRMKCGKGWIMRIGRWERC